MPKPLPFEGFGLPARVAAAIAVGGGTALSLAPFDIIPAVAGYGVLALLVAAPRVGWRSAALTAGAFGFGYHLAGLWWIGAAFLVDAATFGALLPLAVVGLPLGLSLFHAAAGVLAAFAPAGPLRRSIALVAALTVTEFARATVLTGFPWNAPGMGLTGWLALMQPAALIGLTGLNALALIAGTFWICLWGAGWTRFAAALTPIALAGMAVFGLWRLGEAPVFPPDAPTIKVVQPNVAQRDKSDPAMVGPIWARLLAATASGPPADLVVWPETAIPFIYRGEAARGQLSRALGQRQWLMTGAVQPVDQDGARRFTNSVLVTAPDGAIRARYDKQHLVPFGEYVPLSPVLSAVGLRTLVDSASAFVPGQSWRPLAVPGLPAIEPLICYEVIFSRPAPQDISLIVNVTNDAWFGDTPGPHQHLRHARLRAVERGIPVIRAANTGISAVIGPSGRVLARAGLGEEATLITRLPAARATIRDSVQPFVILLIIVAFWGIAVASNRRL